MKKIKFIFAFLAIAGMFMVTSCGTDDTIDPPTIQFLTGPEYTSTSVVVAPGSDIRVGVEAFSQENSTLKRFNFSVQDEAGVLQSFFDTTFSTTSYTFDEIIEVQDVEASVNYIFTVYDDQNQSNQIQITVTTEAAPGNIRVYENVVLGAQNSAVGSSFASSNGTVYTLADARANSALIDWIYFYDSNFEACIAAPNDTDAHNAFGDYVNAPANWDTKNPTKFQFVELPEGTLWADITNDLTIVRLATDVEESKVAFLGVGKIIAFRTVAGKLGLLRVEEITQMGDPLSYQKGTITYSIKVQE
ncbi:MAG: hypothetical protein ACOXZ9_01025 [Bacteroidales bacterium]|jgi:hypothetical protein